MTNVPAEPSEAAVEAAEAAYLKADLTSDRMWIRLALEAAYAVDALTPVAALVPEQVGALDPVKLLAMVTRTGRGFEFMQFLDYYEKPCHLQSSSLAIYKQPGTSAVWLGRAEFEMHLTDHQVRSLVAHLQAWLDGGSFALAPSPAPAHPAEPDPVRAWIEGLTEGQIDFVHGNLNDAYAGRINHIGLRAALLALLPKEGV